MSRANPLALFAVLAAFATAVSALLVTAGGLYMTQHEADMLHLLDILTRIERGEVPHIDFMTPIGAFSFLPISTFMGVGMGVGEAFWWSQISLALALVPVLWWTGWTRFAGVRAHVFGLLCLVLVMALMYGGTAGAISISMYYNRWAWALAFVAVSLAVLRPIGRTLPVVDGLLIGLCVAALAMIKVTYVVALAPALVVALAMRQSRSTFISAAIGGLVVVVGVTLWGGVAYWPAYIGDLVTVAASDTRAKPSADLVTTLVAPAYLGGTAAAIAAIILLRRSGAAEAGILALLLFPGFVYIAYQNFGNDPIWLALFALLILEMRDEGDPEAARPAQSLLYVAVISLALIAPTMINLAFSPVRNATANPEDFTPILPGNDRHTGFQIMSVRANRIDARVALDTPGSGLEQFRALAEREDVTEFRGLPLSECDVMVGLTGWMDAIATDIAEAGYAEGKRLFIADNFPYYWLFNGSEPLTNGAPWYYGELPGWESADYLVVPICSAVAESRNIIIEDIAALDPDLTELRRTPLYALFSIN